MRLPITYYYSINGQPKRVNVVGYASKLPSVSNIKVVNAVISCVCLHICEVTIFKINQAIHVNTISNNLLCAIQLRMNEFKVFECPKYFTENPGESDHVMVVTEIDNME